MRQEGRLSFVKEESKKGSVTRIGFYFDNDKLEWLRKNREMAGAKSNSEFVNKAVDFYAGYLMSGRSQEYLLNTIASLIDAKLGSSDDRNCGMIFKLAVEVAMQNRILAKGIRISDGELEEIREKSIEDVRRIWR